MFFRKREYRQFWYVRHGRADMSLASLMTACKSMLFRKQEPRQFWYTRHGPIVMPLVSLMTVCILFMAIVSDSGPERYVPSGVQPYLPGRSLPRFDVLDGGDDPGLRGLLLSYFGETAHVEPAVHSVLMTKFQPVAPAGTARLNQFAVTAHVSDQAMLNRFPRSTMSAQVRGSLIRLFDADKIISYQGGDYRPRKAQTNILFMGVDQSVSRPNTNATYRDGGQADFLLLIMIDDNKKTIDMLQIDRDTVAEVDTVNLWGEPAGTQQLQLCVSHCFGDGTESSCDNTVKAVRRLLMNAEIDYYIAMNMDGIAVMNDLVGGITVTLADDFSGLDPAMTPGTTLTLQGEQAEYYVRNRKHIGIGTNEARMARQQDYMYRLLDEVVAAIREDVDFLTVMAEGMGPYLVTNMGPAILANEIMKSETYRTSDILQLAGEHRVQGSYMQFIPDTQRVNDLAIALMYEPVA